ncbi:hypothetical protein J7J13_03415 [bacterium]|nr:hypothetical protein [bacterium]
MKKIISSLLLIGIFSFIFLQGIDIAHAGWVSGYFRDNGTYVNGYYKTEPNYYKWDNYSWDGDWSNAYNDKSYYRDYGYDPEPFDDEIPNYDYWSNSNSYDYYSTYDYDYDYDYSYDSYDYDWNW